MAEMLVGTISVLVLLAGVSVYSALKLAKRTDEMVSVVDGDEQPEAPLMVRFPESVFAKPSRPEVTSREL